MPSSATPWFIMSDCDEPTARDWFKRNCARSASSASNAQRYRCNAAGSCMFTAPRTCPPSNSCGYLQSMT